MTAAKRARPPKSTWVCVRAGCGQTFTAWAAAERHSDTTGHHRYETLNPEATNG